MIAALEKPHPKRIEELRRYRERLVWDHKSLQAKADAVKNQINGVDMVLAAVDPTHMPRQREKP